MFVTTAELASYLGKPDSSRYEAQLEAAEAMIAAAIGGDLRERTVTETFRLFYALDADEVLEFSDGPVRSVSSLTISGTAADLTELIVKPWSVRRNGSINQGFEKSFPLVFTTICGWDPDAAVGSAVRMPMRLREAIRAVAAELVLRPQQNIKSERIGDYSYTLDDAGDGEYGLSERTLSMIQYWRHG